MVRPDCVMFSSLLIVRSAGWGRAAPRPPAYNESSMLNASQCFMLNASHCLVWKCCRSVVGKCLRSVVRYVCALLLDNVYAVLLGNAYAVLFSMFTLGCLAAWLFYVRRFSSCWCVGNCTKQVRHPISTGAFGSPGAEEGGGLGAPGAHPSALSTKPT